MPGSRGAPRTRTATPAWVHGLSGRCGAMIYSKCSVTGRYATLRRICRLTPWPGLPATQSRGKRPWSQGPRVPRGLHLPLFLALPGRSGTTGKPRQKALSRRLPHHKKSHSSRGPDPFQIYILSPSPRHSSPGCAASSQAGRARASVGVVGVGKAGFQLSPPGPLSSGALAPRLLSIHPRSRPERTGALARPGLRLWKVVVVFPPW